MNSERAAWITAVVVLLTVGLLIGRQFLDVPDGARVAQRSDPVSGAGAEGSFRQWFWESRRLDLVAQVGLIFTGALGIAALLPQGADADIADADIADADIADADIRGRKTYER